MKRIMLLLISGAVIGLTGCETTKEISLNNEGGGTVVTTTDMSGMISLAKMSPKAGELDKLEEQNIDTTIALTSAADSIPDVSPEERELVRKGMLTLTIDMKKEKFLIKTHFPFTNGSQIARLDQLSSKVIREAMKKKMGEAAADEGMPPGLSDGPPQGSIDDYFTFTYSKGLIEKKLNAAKYANVDSDEGMKSLKEMSSMGMGMGNSTMIIHLPAPAKKAEGRNLVLSDDKRKVTITNTTEDFFDDAKALEYRIEY